MDAYLSPQDIDGSGNAQGINEAVSVRAPVVSVIVAGGSDLPPPGDTSGNIFGPDPGTLLNVGLGYSNGEIQIDLVNSDPSIVNPGVDADDHWAASFQIQNGTTFEITISASTGTAGTGNAERFYSLSFDEVTFLSPATLSVPLVDGDADDSSGATQLNYQSSTPYKTGDGDIAIVDRKSNE